MRAANFTVSSMHGEMVQKERDAIMAIHSFLEHDVLAPDFAKYVYDVLKMFPISLTC